MEVQQLRDTANQSRFFFPTLVNNTVSITQQARLLVNTSTQFDVPRTLHAFNMTQQAMAAVNASRQVVDHQAAHINMVHTLANDAKATAQAALDESMRVEREAEAALASTQANADTITRARSLVREARTAGDPSSRSSAQASQMTASFRQGRAT